MPDQGPYEHILFAVEDGVATITLNRPKRMNAFTFPLGAELERAYARCDADDAVRAVVRRKDAPPVMVLSLEHILESVYCSSPLAAEASQ